MVIDVTKIEIVAAVRAVRGGHEIERVFQIHVQKMGKVVEGNKTAVIRTATLEKRFVVSVVEEGVKRIRIAAVATALYSKDAEKRNRL